MEINWGIHANGSSPVRSNLCKEMASLLLKNSDRSTFVYQMETLRPSFSDNSIWAWAQRERRIVDFFSLPLERLIHRFKMWLKPWILTRIRRLKPI